VIIGVLDSRFEKLLGARVVRFPQQGVAGSTRQHHEGVLLLAGTAAPDSVRETGGTVVSIRSTLPPYTWGE